MLSISQLLNAANITPTDSTVSSSTTTTLTTSDTPSSSTQTSHDTKAELKPKAHAKPHGGRVKKIFKGPWRPCETALLARLVARHGARNWSAIAEAIPGRSGKQARERWKNHLDPALKKGAWTVGEDALIAAGYRAHGNKWSAIARRIPGRSDNDVKNRFNCAIRTRLNIAPLKPCRKAAHGLARAVVFVPRPLRWELDPPRSPPSMFSVFE